MDVCIRLLTGRVMQCAFKGKKSIFISFYYTSAVKIIFLV